MSTNPHTDPGRTRLSADERRSMLVDVGAAVFAAKAYDEVSMEEVAARGRISRTLLYRHFASKRDLFAAVYRKAADRLLEESELDPDVPLAEQVSEGLDAHIDYFLANRNTVLAANRTLAGDPTVQAIIDGELDILRRRMVDAAGLPEDARQVVSAVLVNWLVFVRALTVEWLLEESFPRERLREICLGALLGALGATVDLDRPPVGPSEDEQKAIRHG